MSATEARGEMWTETRLGHRDQGAKHDNSFLDSHGPSETEGFTGAGNLNQAGGCYERLPKVRNGKDILELFSRGDESHNIH